MRRGLGFTIGSALAAAVIASPAAATTVTLGTTAPPGTPGGTCGGGCDSFQTTSEAGLPGYTVPPGIWTLDSWRARGGASSTDTLQLRIYRRTAVPQQYTLVNQTAPASFPPAVVTPYAADILVKGGDLLGLQGGPTSGNTPHVYTAAAGNIVTGLAGTEPEVGMTYGPGFPPISESSGVRVNLEATLTQPDPPASAPKKCKKGRKLKKGKCVKKKRKKK